MIAGWSCSTMSNPSNPSSTVWMQPPTVRKDCRQSLMGTTLLDVFVAGIHNCQACKRRQNSMAIASHSRMDPPVPPPWVEKSWTVSLIFWLPAIYCAIFTLIVLRDVNLLWDSSASAIALRCCENCQPRMILDRLEAPSLVWPPGRKLLSHNSDYVGRLP